MSQAKRNERKIDKQRRALSRQRFNAERRQHLDSVKRAKQKGGDNGLH